MKAEELMIGDWVIEKDRVCRVSFNTTIEEVRKEDCATSASSGTRYYDIEPIPLTPEILEKNGFDREDNFFGKTCYVILKHDTQVMVFITPNEYYWLEVNITQKYTMLFGIKMRVKFVHELQHALRLCGIEKEIVL